MKGRTRSAGRAVALKTYYEDQSQRLRQKSATAQDKAGTFLVQNYPMYYPMGRYHEARRYSLDKLVIIEAGWVFRGSSPLVRHASQVQPRR
ncbi:MAG: hypothetical protein L6R35_006242, partial [Caloplaca aegaea]